MTRLRYMPELDGLRAVAITLVVACHAIPAFHFGMLGVDVFFVLSGFLITTLIADGVRTGEFSRRRFYIRRAIRLVPALVVTIVVFAPIAAAVVGPSAWLGAVAALLYVTPLVPLTIFSHTWTLAFEEWFYLLWPVVLAKFCRDRLTLRQIAALIGSLAFAIQAGMAIAPGSIGARPAGLLAGAALGLWWLDGGRFTLPSVAIGGGVTMILTGAFGGFVLWGPLPFWLAVCGAMLTVAGIASGGAGPVSAVLRTAPIVAVGVVSYEWYLLHQPMLRIGTKLWGDSSLWLLVPASLLLAFGLHYALAPFQTRMRAKPNGDKVYSGLSM